MIPGVVARRYARAILELGSEANTLDALVDEIGRIAATYDGSQELQDALQNPLVGIASKKGILEELAGKLTLSPVAKNVLFLLNERRRMPVLPGIAQELRTLRDARRGIVRAEVTSAKPLSEDYYAKLKVQLERLTGKKIEIDKKLDPELLAGVVARIGDTVYDGSLRARLAEMKSSLLN